MIPEPFALERYFARYEFSAPLLLSCSDCEPLTLNELLSYADEGSKKLWNELSLGYTESQGHPVLRTEIANLYEDVDADDIIVLAPEEGIFIAMHTLLAPGDHVVAMHPGYQSLYEIAHALGCEVSFWEMRDGRFFVDDLQQLVREDTKLIVVNFPHNPTGYLPGRDEFARIIDLAKGCGASLFSDEMYRMLEYDQRDRLPSASEVWSGAISLFGMSKTFSLAGLRIGWLVVRDAGLREKMQSFKDYTTICSSAPSEALAIIALRARERIIARNLEIIEKNLVVLDDFFKRHPQFVWRRPLAGSMAFPELKEGKIDDLCTDLVTERGVMLLPSHVYGTVENRFRIGFGRKNMPEAIAALERHLDS